MESIIWTNNFMADDRIWGEIWLTKSNTIWLSQSHSTKTGWINKVETTLAIMVDYSKDFDKVDFDH